MHGNAYQVKIENFEGPLDLLLHLIEVRKLHINDISLGQITDDYLAHIQGLGAFPLKEAAHFILVASTLLLIKSRSLLPHLTLSEEEEGDIRDLERRLKEYQRIQELSRHVHSLYGSQPIFSSQIDTQTITPVFSPTKQITTKNILASIRAVISLLPKKELIPQVFIKKIMSLEEAVESLLARVKDGLAVRFNELSKGHEGPQKKMGIIMSFLAVLELLKQGIISVQQEEHFGDLTIEKGTKA